jgi:hypothetical protein
MPTDAENIRRLAEIEDSSGLAFKVGVKDLVKDRLHGHSPNHMAAEQIDKQKRAEDALWDELASDSSPQRQYIGIERDASPFTESSGSSREGSFLRREMMEGCVTVSENLLGLETAGINPHPPPTPPPLASPRRTRVATRVRH